jgi:uncharacterized protein YnzC (UPF0291/DUF896 family)
MNQEKIKRINELAKKSKETPLSPEELAEQKSLRDEYIAEFRAQFRSTLENTVVQDPDGTRTPLQTYMKDRKQK